MEMARIGTKTLETRFVCDFVVRNFEQLLASHPVGRSMSVPFCTYDMFKADFHVYPNGVEGDPGFLVTGIVRTDDIPKPVTASFGVKLLHPGLPISVHSCKDFKERTWDPETEHMDFRHVSVDAIRNHYLDETGSIILRVEFTLKTSLKECDDRQRINTNYINEVGSLLQSHTFSDVVLIAQGKEFKAHRNILCARSSAFESMLLGHMSESSSGRIEISDAAPETLASFLEFLYTGTCKVNADDRFAFGLEGIDDIADMLLVIHANPDEPDHDFCLDVLQPVLQAWGDLLVLADKYCAIDLITFCESKLINWLCVPTAAFILKVASEASRRELKLRVLAFITLDDSKMHAVHDTRSFDDLPRELQLEVMEACMNIKQSRKRSSVAISGFEFPDNSDWMRLSNAQLRRACAEWSLSTAGSRETLLKLLQAQAL